MKAIKNYLWNLAIFLTTPVLLLVTEMLGISVPNYPSAVREYSRSMYQRANVVFVMFVQLIVIFLAIPDVRVATVVSSLIFIVFISLFTPQVLLSYETWNWWKLASFQRQLHHYKSRGCDNSDVAKLIENFLIREAVITEMYGYHTWDRFHHLFHLFRTLEYWRRSKKELYKLSGIGDCNLDVD